MTSPPHHVAVSGWGFTNSSLRTLGSGLLDPGRPATRSCGCILHRGGTEPLWRRPSIPALHAGRAGYSHMLSCRTKLAMLLCLKYLGSTSLANWPWSNTWKLFPLCWETRRRVTRCQRGRRCRREVGNPHACPLGGGGRP